MESKIRELLVQLLQKYKHLAGKVSGIGSLNSEIERMQATVDINAEMQEVKRIENALQPLREQFQSSGGVYSEELSELVEESKKLVAQLIYDVKELEMAAKSECENLAPQIRFGVLAKQMQHAYNNNR